ncbi:MAG TPA: DegT/DnrJ/EryC1/StrS family aminotransferase, partial [Myxococcota bacterium]|nr:DegT/DnrJ/EryC1/StrS family aminotransferase [Myxococcota bacterium]HQK51139.1 DegT/DnrJ/EryC1/StrS family aminotransferase [Myxococcota bacterium]
AQFEQAFATWLGVRHAVAFASGKAALAAWVRVLGLGPGDRLLLPALDAPEVPALIRGLGIGVRVADISPVTYGLDPDRAAEVQDPQVRGVLVPHLYGNPADLDRLSRLASDRGWVLIEDCAQALGARWHGRMVGAQGHPAFFSFGLMKNLNSLQGGMAVTNDDRQAAALRGFAQALPDPSPLAVLRDLGLSLTLWTGTRRLPFAAAWPVLRVVEALDPSLVHRAARLRPSRWEQASLDPVPLMRRMSPIQAGAGIQGLPRVLPEAHRRRAHAETLIRALSSLPGLDLPGALAPADPVWTHLVVRVQDRYRWRRRLLRRGIDTTTGYLKTLHREDPEAGPCPVAEDLEARSLYLPIWPELDARDIDRIIDAMREGTKR